MGAGLAVRRLRSSQTGSDSDPRATTRVGLLGCGVVGSEVARALLQQSKAQGAKLSLDGVAVAHPQKKRSIDLPIPLVTGDAFAIVKDPEIDLVVELIGGVELPATLIRHALVEGKSVVTANKEVVALHGEELLALAKEHGVGFYFEGAVGGAVPMVNAISEALAGDRLKRFSGVLNGTSNFVLTTVATTGISVDEAIVIAQQRGYAERDPSDDLNGADAARKAAVLSTLGFGSKVLPDDVFTRGIQELSVEDVAAAQFLGFATKLVVKAEEYAGFLHVSVEPCAVPESHPLAQVDGSTNMLIVDAELSGRLVFSGAGAGGRETAGAVLGDIRRATRGTPSVEYEKRTHVTQVHKAKENPGRFLARCLTAGLDAADDIIGSLIGNGVGVARLERFESDAGHEVVLITDYGERSCIERAIHQAESEGVVCLSLLKILEEDALSPVGGCLDAR